MKIKDLHLDEDQVIRCVVDENDLPVSVRNHLFACPACQRKKEQIEKELTSLGRMAKESAPLPRQEIRLPFHKPRGLWSSWRPVFATGIAVVLLIAGIWWSGLVTTSREKMTARIIGEAEEDSQLTAEIDALEEYAPYDFYPDISGESDPDYFDEFLEFVVPLEENQNKEA